MFYVVGTIFSSTLQMSNMRLRGSYVICRGYTDGRFETQIWRQVCLIPEPMALAILPGKPKTSRKGACTSGIPQAVEKNVSYLGQRVHSMYQTLSSAISLHKQGACGVCRTPTGRGMGWERLYTFSLALQSCFHWLLGRTFSLYLKTAKHLAAKGTKLPRFRSR